MLLNIIINNQITFFSKEAAYINKLITENRVDEIELLIKLGADINKLFHTVFITMVRSKEIVNLIYKYGYNFNEFELNFIKTCNLRTIDDLDSVNNAKCVDKYVNCVIMEKEKLNLDKCVVSKGKITYGIK